MVSIPHRYSKLGMKTQNIITMVMGQSQFLIGTANHSIFMPSHTSSNSLYHKNVQKVGQPEIYYPSQALILSHFLKNVKMHLRSTDFFR